MTSITIYELRKKPRFEREDDIKISGDARLILDIDTETDTANYYEDSKYFDIRKKLFADNSSQNKAGRYIFHPLFLKNVVYGYMVCSTQYTDLTLNALLLRIISATAIQVFGYNKTIQQKEKLETENKELSERAKELDEYSKTDELTKLLNRRGFLEYGQRLIHFSEDINAEGVVVFADLDGLKYINDNFGHEYGDKAIKAESEVLRQAFRKMDVIGRLSGDEFGIVASGMDMDFIEKTRKKVDELNEKVTKKYEFPFKLSISLGATVFGSGNTDLNSLLKDADKELYKQKKIHHAKIKNKASSK
jgi:diguanylate cyclase (GGDEF)-like protein